MEALSEWPARYQGTDPESLASMALGLDMSTSSGASEPPGFVVHNVVCTCQISSTKMPLDLQTLSNLLPSSSYCKRIFAAVTIRTDNPFCTALLFSSSKLVITGQPPHTSPCPDTPRRHSPCKGLFPNTRLQIAVRVHVGVILHREDVKRGVAVPQLPRENLQRAEHGGARDAPGARRGRAGHPKILPMPLYRINLPKKDVPRLDLPLSQLESGNTHVLFGTGCPDRRKDRGRHCKGVGIHRRPDKGFLHKQKTSLTKKKFKVNAQDRTLAKKTKKKQPWG